MLTPHTQKIRSRRAILACATLWLAFAAPAAANTYTPNKLADHAPNGCTPSDCTLREAITKANHRHGPDVVVVRGGKTYKLALPNSSGDEDLNATGDLDVRGSLTIRSSNKQRATINANSIDRVFETGSSGTIRVVLSRLVVRGGLLNPPGVPGAGALVDAGTLKIVRSRVGPNNGDGQGGGVSVDGATARATILKSTITANTVGNGGGAGLGVGDGAHVDVVGSTINGNQTFDQSGGGIEVTGGGSLAVTNSTITKNDAKFGGGGIGAYSAGPVSLRSVTVARNNGDANGFGFNGGGLESSGTTFRVRNSIVALNSVSSSGSGPDCYGTFISAGVNLLSDVSGCSGFGSDIVTSTPKLGPLAANGGPTETIALRPGSPAIGNAGSGSPPRDQRGVKRVDPDIGAFERR